VNRFLKNVEYPPIIKLRREVKGEYIDLTQAVPSYPMTDILKNYAKKALFEENTEFYTSDFGEENLRKKIAYLYKNINYNEIICTAGANQAFYLLLSAISNAEDKLTLFTPYYFNHKMTGDILGLEINYFNYFEKKLDEFENYAKKSDIVVVVNPSNPTGKFFVPDEVEKILYFCKKYDKYVIFDETYSYFEKNFVSAKDVLNYEKLFVVSSFSKTFSLSGFRIGYLAASKKYIDEIIKIQDCMVICAPKIAQKLASFALENVLNSESFEKNMKYIEKNATFLRNTTFSNYEVLSAGAFFGYLKPKNKKYGFSFLKENGFLVMPGKYFTNKDGEEFRISLGNYDNLKKLVNFLKKV
jgi:aspartate/methionine/tyrosine aminotransferase